jgi:hypothetical protein
MKLKQKAITVIEGLCLAWENNSKSLDLADAIITDIYKYSHIADGSCKCGHQDWKKELHATYKNLRKNGIV